MAISNADGSIILTTKLDVTPVSKALEGLKAKFSSLREQKAAIQTLTTAIRDQQFVIKDLERQYALLIAKGDSGSQNAEELKERIKELKAELEQLKVAASDMGAATDKASSKAASGLKKFGKRIAGIVKSAVIFSVLYKVMQAVVKLFQNILMSDEEFRQDWEELKAAFYTAAYPIVNLIVPAIKWIVGQVRDWAVSIGRVAAALQGITYSELVDQAKASKKAADNYAKMEKDSAKTAKNVKKQLATFDTIQTLSSGKEEYGGSGQYTGFNNLKKYDTSGVTSMLSAVMSAVGGSLMALGVILLFHGQIAWGIGLIIAGATGIAMAKLTDENVSEKVKEQLSNALSIVGVIAIAIGVLLCMAGSWGYGIGAIVLGASSIVTVVAVNWNAIKEALIEQQDKVTLAGSLMVVLGIFMCVAGMWGLGIGAIIMGATLLVTEAVLNWNSIKEKLKEEEAQKWIIIGGTMAVVLGILLCFASRWGLGIGLIAAGASTLGFEIALNWDSLKLKIEETARKHKALFILGSFLLVVLGVALLFTGVGIPFGLAWIAAGAQGISTGITEDWDFIPNKIKEVWRKVKQFWKTNIAPVFTLKWWKDLAIACGNGLIEGFEGAINGIIWAFESMINWIVNGLNKISFEMPDWLPGWMGGGETFGINIKKANLGRVSIPRLAQGAVIPANREFLAVLGDQKQGTNIEAPLQTIVDAMNIALAQNNGAGHTTKEEHYYLGETELMQIVYKLFKGGERLRGGSLVSGGKY